MRPEHTFGGVFEGGRAGSPPCTLFPYAKADSFPLPGQAIHESQQSRELQNNTSLWPLVQDAWVPAVVSHATGLPPPFAGDVP
eukprot:6213054-Pleurochrysis_carterae.AAC.1